jgi:hypothetical protein
MKLFVKDGSRSATKFTFVRAPETSRQFFDGAENQGVPVSVLPKNLRLRVKDGKELSTAQSPGDDSEE